MYQYLECGLDNVLLSNGFIVRETPYGKGVAIHDVKGLHRVIGRCIAEGHSPLTGSEFKFLRVEMDLSQRRLGALWDVSEQTIANYEKGKGKIPRLAGQALRWLFLESINEQSRIKETLNELVELDNQLDELERQQVAFKENENGGWEPAPLAA